MGAVEVFDWQLADGRVMRVTVDRGLLALEMAHRMRKWRNGTKTRMRCTMGDGSVVATIVGVPAPKVTP